MPLECLLQNCIQTVMSLLTNYKQSLKLARCLFYVRHIYHYQSLQGAGSGLLYSGSQPGATGRVLLQYGRLQSSGAFGRVTPRE